VKRFLPRSLPPLLVIALLSAAGLTNMARYVDANLAIPENLGVGVHVQGSNSMGMMMAGSLLMTLPVVAIFFFAQRYFIQGIAMTGMKG
jgi:multiple sugar transport system permease protein